MKKKTLLVLLGLTAALTVTACGNTDTAETEPAGETAETEQSAAPDEETFDTEELESEDADIEEILPEEEVDEEDEEPFTELEIESFQPSDYLVENVEDYITPGNLKGLKVTQYIYEITDDVVQSEIEAEVSMYGGEEEVDRPAEEGDIIYVDLTSTIEGSDEDPVTDSTYFYLGDEEYGEEFDEALIGASAGDSLSFSITFDDDIYDEDWIDETVDFEAEVTAVDEITEPEYNDEFVSENFGYDTTEEFEAAYKEYLEEEYNELSLMDAMDSLMDTALSECVFSGYPDDLYAACKEETIDSYAIFFDIDDEEELLEELEMTEDDLDEEVSSLAARRLLISYICEENDLDVTEEEYLSFVNEYAEYYGYDNAYEFEQDLTRSYLVWSMFETEAAEYLYENADINEVPYDDLYLDDEDYYYDDEDYDDDDYEDEDYYDDDEDWDDETDDWLYWDDEEESELD